jgi:alanine-synthesizing transaminase
MCLAGEKKHAKGYIEGLNLLASMRLCSNVPAQSIIQTSLGGYQSSDKYLVPGGRIYEQREYICRALNSIPGVSAVRPDAAFYIFPRLDPDVYDIQNDVEFALGLLKMKKILITYGTGFNWDKPDHFRIVYLPNLEQLAEAMEGIEDYLKLYKRK